MVWNTGETSTVTATGTGQGVARGRVDDRRERTGRLRERTRSRSTMLGAHRPVGARCRYGRTGRALGGDVMRAELSPAVPMAETELWARVQDGDGEAFALLYRRHSARVLRLCRGLIVTDGRHDDVAGRSEDLASGAFLHAWRRRGDIVVESSILPWLLATAAHLHANDRRARIRAHRLLRRVAALRETLGGAQHEVEAAAQSSVFVERVRAAVTTLAPPYRSVADLCILRDLSVRDAATRLGVPEGTVKSRLHHARGRLRAALG